MGPQGRGEQVVGVSMEQHPGPGPRAGAEGGAWMLKEAPGRMGWDGGDGAPEGLSGGGQGSDCREGIRRGGRGSTGRQWQRSEGETRGWGVGPEGSQPWSED